MTGYKLATSHTELTLRHRLTGGDDDRMPGRASDLIVIPGSFWERPQVIAALEARDVGRLFALVRQYAGASQTQIAIACGMTQGKVSDIMRGAEIIRSLARFERIADGLQLPDVARITIGLAPRSAPAGHATIPSPICIASILGTRRKRNRCDAVPSSAWQAPQWSARSWLTCHQLIRPIAPGSSPLSSPGTQRMTCPVGWRRLPKWRAWPTW